MLVSKPGSTTGLSSSRSGNSCSQMSCLMPDKINIYHHLPYLLKVASPSLWGFYLRGWRYGSDTGPWIETALERESWGKAKWDAWQAERLAPILHRAATR